MISYVEEREITGQNAVIATSGKTYFAITETPKGVGFFTGLSVDDLVNQIEQETSMQSDAVSKSYAAIKALETRVLSSRVPSGEIALALARIQDSDRGALDRYLSRNPASQFAGLIVLFQQGRLGR